jgi:hypothetical protein
MDAPDFPTDDLNELEQRLAAWRPSTTGLAPDAMLFAAGRASAGGGKAWLVWPLLSGCLALAAIVLGVWVAVERSERRALLQALDQRLPAPGPANSPGPEKTRPTGPPAPDSYLSLRREWEQLSGDWAIGPAAPGKTPRRPASAEKPILRAWQRF